MQAQRDGQRRRKFTEKEDGRVPVPASRADDSRPDQHGRSSHSYGHPSESHGTPSSYEMSRDSWSSRRRDDDWRATESSNSSHDRYASGNDSYRRGGGRDDYERAPPRESDSGWAGRSAGPSRYPPRDGGGEWTERYDRGSSTSHPDSNSNAWSDRPPHDNRSATYDRRAEESPSGRESRPPARHADDRPPDREDRGWQRDDRNPQNWKRDSGWGSRGADNRDKNWEEPTRNRDEPPHPGGSRSGNDRPWDPPPSWKSQRPGDQPYPKKNKNKGKKKGNRNYNNQRGGWRDDGEMNNWTKRDFGYSRDRGSREPPRRRPLRSFSRSPSRSPARSYDSRRSGRPRSRSRSFSPRGRRRGSSPPHRSPPLRTPPPRSPPPRRANDRGPRYSRSPASSYRSYESRGHPRGRSISSASSRTRSRSRSPSSSPPPRRPKAVHRLPPATSVEDIAKSLTKPVAKVKDVLPGREPAAQKNGFVDLNGHHYGADTHRRPGGPKPLGPTASMIAMPPPGGIPGYTDNVKAGSEKTTPPSYSPRKPDSPTTTRGNTVKPAGFKPIGQGSSSLKRFFPGDDDDDDDNNLPAALPPARSSAVAEALSTPLGRQPPSPMKQPPMLLSPTNASQQRLHQGRVEGLKHSSLSVPAGPGTPSPQMSSRHPSQEEPKPLRDLRVDEKDPSRLSTPTAPTREFTGEPENRSSELYAIVSQVGEGTFGKVYKARNTANGVHVALKRIRMEQERDGFPVTAMREIKLLQSLRHVNVVRLFEMMVSNGSVYMVFEYMDHDLTGVLTQTQFSFTDGHLKSLCQQMLKGLAYLHHKGVIHRDIKGSNILINNRGELKLADFGLARFYQKRRRADYTNRVITLWYRPPELLLGTTVYGPEVDMWSAGCIMLELYTKKPVFQGNDDISQLDSIYRIFGTPTPERWPRVTDMPWYELVKPKEVIQNHFRVLFRKWLSPAAMDLAERLLTFDPAQRATATQALEAGYFTQEDPPPVLPDGLASLEGEWHELEAKRERERAKKRRRTESEPQ